MNRFVLVSSLLSLAFVAAACGGADPSTAPKPAVNPPSGNQSKPAGNSSAAVQEAQNTFNSLCSTCHGTTGHGDGPGAAALDPKPRSFADAAWQDSVDDAHIKKTIVYGGAAVGKSAMMVANPQLKGKDDVLDALVKIIRAYRGK